MAAKRKSRAGKRTNTGRQAETSKQQRGTGDTPGVAADVPPPPAWPARGSGRLNIQARGAVNARRYVFRRS